MSDESGYSGAQVLLAFLAGALVGSAAALLSTPRTGSDTRDAVRGWAQTAGSKAGRLPDVLRQAGEAARRAFNESLRERRQS